MKKTVIPMILLLILSLVAISGCTTKQATNGTFGEKNVSLNSINVLSNATGEHLNNNGVGYYLIQGYVQNNNQYDAFNVKLQATVYDADNNTINQTDQVYINPKNIPSQGVSYFSVEFPDQNSTIVRFEIKAISASAYA